MTYTNYTYAAPEGPWTRDSTALHILQSWHPHPQSETETAAAIPRPELYQQDIPPYPKRIRLNVNK